MDKIIGTRGIGKTSKIIRAAYENDAVLVVNNVKYVKALATLSGYEGVNIISYFEYVNNFANVFHRPVLIDEIDGFLQMVYPDVVGYSASIE